VVIVCGETGSGKTTQLPKICLELGRGVAGLIGHTQPRRIAARATASRIAQELKSELGSTVGYKIRFTDRIGPQSYIKLMTDGILLAETQGDPLLSAYDTDHRRGPRAQPQHRFSCSATCASCSPSGRT
jgi:ATP-dependent helicase HrpA